MTDQREKQAQSIVAHKLRCPGLARPDYVKQHVKRTINLPGGSTTSISLEPEFWAVVEQFAPTNTSVGRILVDIEPSRTNRAAALRIMCLEWAMARQKPERGY